MRLSANASEKYYRNFEWWRNESRYLFPKSPLSAPHQNPKWHAEMVRQPFPPAQPRRCISQGLRANGPGNIENPEIRQGHHKRLSPLTTFPSVVQTYRSLKYMHLCADPGRVDSPLITYSRRSQFMVQQVPIFSCLLRQAGSHAEHLAMSISQVQSPGPICSFFLRTFAIPSGRWALT